MEPSDTIVGEPSDPTALYQITGACRGGDASPCWAPVCSATPQAAPSPSGGAGPSRGCVACSDGMLCPAGSLVPQQAAGFKANVLGGGEYSVYSCPYGPPACPAGPVGRCGGGTIGIMCVECPMQPEWTYWDEAALRCAACAEESALSVLILPVSIIVVLAAMCVVYRNALPAPGRQELPTSMEVTISLAQLLVVVQMGSVLGAMEIPWGHPIQDILDALRIFMLDLTFLKLDCAAGLTYAERFIVGSFVPLMLIFIYGIAALVLMRFLQVRDAAVRCLNASGMGMHLDEDFAGKV